MKQEQVRDTTLRGRVDELKTLEASLEEAMDGNGSSMLISGEPGIGKTRLVEEFRKIAEGKNAKILWGAAAADAIHPFLIFSEILKGEIARPLFHQEEYTSFAEVFAVNRKGHMVAQASAENKELDADVFASMLMAVQDFVRDSFDQDGKTGLGRLEYGDMKVLVHHGQRIFLAAVVKGSEHPDMNSSLNRCLADIEKRCRPFLESECDETENFVQIQQMIKSLTEIKFLVKRELEGVNLKNERLRISNLILNFLEEISESRPLAVIMEDLHWADESSIFVLEFLARNIRGRRIFILCTARPLETEFIQLSVNKMISEEILKGLVLGGLDKTSLKSIVDENFNQNSFPESFVMQLIERCEGNPFFLIEVMRQMKEEESIQIVNGLYHLVNENYTIPATVEEVVNRHIRTLQPDSLAMAEYISCIGRIFKRIMAMSINTIKDTGNTFENLRYTHIINAYNGTGEFTHAIMQEVIYSGITKRWKSAYHKSLGEYYESASRDNIDEAIYDLARHFYRTNEHEKAFEYSIRAAIKAENAFALEQTLIFYNQAADVAGHLKSVSPEKKMMLDMGLGDAHALLGNYDDALERFESALVSESDMLKKARIHKRMADIYTWKTDYDRAREICEKGLEIIGPNDQVERAKFFNALGRLSIRKGDFDTAQGYMEKCLAISDLLNNTNVLAMTEILMGVIFAQKGLFDKALIHYNKGRAMEEENGNIFGLASVLNNIGLVHYSTGNLTEALEFHKQSLAIKKKIGDKYAIAGSLINIGLVYYDRGELDKALDYYRQSFEIKNRLGDQYGLSLIHTYIGMVFHQKGEFDKSLESFNRVLEMTENTKDKFQIADLYYNMAYLYLTFEQPDAAIEYLKKCIAIAEEAKIYHILVFSLYRMVETLLMKEDTEKASEYIAQAHAKEVELLGESDIEVKYHATALLHIEKKEFEEANKVISKGMEIFERLGKRRELAQLQMDRSALALSKGDLVGARQDLGTAHSMYNQMGMQLWESRSREMLEKL